MEYVKNGPMSGMTGSSWVCPVCGDAFEGDTFPVPGQDMMCGGSPPYPYCECSDGENE